MFPAGGGAERRGGGDRISVQQRSPDGRHIQPAARRPRHPLWWESSEALLTLQEIVGVPNCLCVCPADLELYNEALKVIHDFPQHYPFEAAVSG